MIKITEIATKCEWKVPEDIPIFLNYSGDIAMTDYIFVALIFEKSEWIISYKGINGRHYEYFLNSSLFTVSDTDYIAKDIIRETLKNNLGVSNKEYNFIMDELHIPISQIE